MSRVFFELSEMHEGVFMFKFEHDDGKTTMTFEVCISQPEGADTYAATIKADPAEGFDSVEKAFGGLSDVLKRVSDALFHASLAEGEEVVWMPVSGLAAW